MCVTRYQMKALAILHRLIPVIRGLEKNCFFSFTLHFQNGKNEREENTKEEKRMKINKDLVVDRCLLKASPGYGQ